MAVAHGRDYIVMQFFIVTENYVEGLHLSLQQMQKFWIVGLQERFCRPEDEWEALLLRSPEEISA